MKDKLKNPKVKKFIIYALVFFAGMLLAPHETQYIDKVVTKEVPMQNEADWKRLKEVDDQGFTACADFATSTGNAWTAIANGKFSAIDGYYEDIKDITAKINDVASQRKIILNKLGY